MKTMMLFLAVVSLAGFTTSNLCAADNKELILGKWIPEEAKNKGIDTVIEFLKDGSVKIAVTGNGLNLNLDGKYKFIDDNTLEVTVTPPGADKSITRKSTLKSINADEMVMVDEGKEQKLKRSK